MRNFKNRLESGLVAENQGPELLSAPETLAVMVTSSSMLGELAAGEAGDLWVRSREGHETGTGGSDAGWRSNQPLRSFSQHYPDYPTLPELGNVPMPVKHWEASLFI
jgi:hypothetical protein